MCRSILFPLVIVYHSLLLCCCNIKDHREAIYSESIKSLNDSSELLKRGSLLCYERLSSDANDFGGDLIKERYEAKAQTLKDETNRICFHIDSIIQKVSIETIAFTENQSNLLYSEVHEYFKLVSNLDLSTNLAFDKDTVLTYMTANCNKKTFYDLFFKHSSNKTSIYGLTKIKFDIRIVENKIITIYSTNYCRLNVKWG